MLPYFDARSSPPGAHCCTVANPLSDVKRFVPRLTAKAKR